MTIDTIVTDLLDQVNRPKEEVAWTTRATNAVNDALMRLFQKFQFELFRSTVDITVSETETMFNVSDTFQVVNGIYKVSSFTDIHAKRIPVQIIDSITANIDIQGIAHYHIPSDAVIKYGLSFYTTPRKFYKVDGYLNLNSAKASELFESIFLEQARDFIMYDAWVRLAVLLNNDAEQISIVKTLRDEAYNDVINWNDKFNLKGPINIIG